MECIVCKQGVVAGDKIVQIIRAEILDNNGCVLYDEIAEEGIIHVRCFSNLIDGKEQVVASPSVERNNILEFLK
jgi:hypothetical protein